jgi:lipopolysaccharide biosynthesis regulator YciM
LNDFWADLEQLLSEPLVLEGIAALLLFILALLVYRRIRLIAEGLERRKALAEYVRGLDDALRGEYRAAITSLTNVLERDPENVEARIALGDCFRALGDAAEAKKHHHHVHRVFGHDLARNFVSLGQDELSLGNLDAAADAFGRVLELSPENEEALAGLAAAYGEAGDPVAAAETLRRLYPDGPRSDLNPKERREAARRFTDAGAAALQGGDGEGAIRFYAEALAYQPEQMRARTGLLSAAHALKDPERAKTLVREQLEALRELSRQEEVLFEPAPAAAGGERAGEEKTLLPAKVDELGSVVAAVEERTARYLCATCGALLKEYAPTCPVCADVGSVEGHPDVAPLYTKPLPEIREVVDEVHESPAFLQRLTRKAAAGDEAALRSLIERGTKVLFEVFAALPAIDARRYLGQELAALGEDATREVRACHAAQGGRGALDAWREAIRPHDEFAAGFFLRLGGEAADGFFAELGGLQDPALAGAMADPGLDDKVRDTALERLGRRGLSCAVSVVRAVAASGDAGALDRAADLFKELGADVVRQIEGRYFSKRLLGRLFRGRGTRQRAAADILARTGLAEAGAALHKAAATERDPALRGHYSAALERLRGSA